MELDKLLKEVAIGQTTVFDVADKTGGRHLTIEARRLLPEEPRPLKRAESPARGHEFLSAPSLAAYLERYGSEKTVVFADPVRELVHAVIDETAEGGFEVVTMKPAVHPLWKPWTTVVDGAAMDIKDFALFVMMNRRSIAKPDGRALALDFGQIRASVDMEIFAGRGKNAANGVVVKTKVASGSEQTGSVELPDSLELFVPLYVDSERQKLEVDLCIEAGSDGEIEATVTGGTVAEARVQAFQDMVEVVRSRCPKATVAFGSPKHAAWNYLRELDAGKA